MHENIVIHPNSHPENYDFPTGEDFILRMEFILEEAEVE